MDDVLYAWEESAVCCTTNTERKQTSFLYFIEGFLFSCKCLSIYCMCTDIHTRLPYSNNDVALFCRLVATD